MKPTERAKQALAYKLVDYLCDDPENNMANIMGKIDALAPASLFAEQRAAFSDAIKNKTNMYQLIMRVMDLNTTFVYSVTLESSASFAESLWSVLYLTL